jgi:uncharacterized protein YggU (UPF0235/DUF167 family)
MNNVPSSLIQVQAHVSSKKPRIEKRGEILHVYTSAKAIEGQANSAITEDLAKYFKVPKSHINMYKGVKSKIKLFRIS